MPGTPSKASPKLTAFWRKVSPEMILSEAVEVCNSPEVARGRLLPTTVTSSKSTDCSVSCAWERMGVLIKRIDKTMGLSVVCVILVSHHISKGCYYITFHCLYDKIFEKKGRLKTKRGFQTAFSLYVGLNENGTISLLPGLGKAESHGRLFAFIESITWFRQF